MYIFLKLHVAENYEVYWLPWVSHRLFPKRHVSLQGNYAVSFDEEARHFWAYRISVEFLFLYWTVILTNQSWKHHTLFLIAYLKQAYESERERLVMEKDAVANELATLEEQLSASKAQITSLSETLEKQKDKVVQDAVICSLRPKLYVVLTFLGL